MSSNITLSPSIRRLISMAVNIGLNAESPGALAVGVCEICEAQGFERGSVGWNAMWEAATVGALMVEEAA
jgi:hypothetical protein